MDNGARSSAPTIRTLHVAENIGEDMLHELGDAFTAVQLGGKPRVASRLVRIANIDADLAAAEKDFLLGLMCAGASCPISLRALGQLRTFSWGSCAQGSPPSKGRTMPVHLGNRMPWFLMVFGSV